MSTQAQDVFNRAIALSDANQEFLTITPAEVLARLNYANGQLFTRLAQENRFFYFVQASATSTGGATGRVLDLSALTIPIERLLDGGLVLPTGATINLVDFQDQGAEFAPRGYALGLKIVEIGAEWSATPGVVAVQVNYVSRPADLNVAGDLTQLLTLPDRFTSWFDYDLAIYFAQKDIGRVQADPNEKTFLAALQEAVYQDILQYLDHVIGPVSRRFLVPGSPKGDKA